MQIELLIVNASQVLIPTEHENGFGALKIVENGAVACADGKIIACGTTDELPGNIDTNSATTIIDATGKLVAPGFIDPHTHPVFHGTREKEFVMRLQGKSYREIAEAGGGIRSSVRNLRNASEEMLLENVLTHLDLFLKHGTTTIEAKSGYGLSMEDELKSLRVIQKANAMHPVDLVPTFLGAHEVPDEYRERREYYIDMLIQEMMPRVKEEGLAEFCDVFCEEHVFNVEESRRILSAAQDLGFKIKIHADQLAAGTGSMLSAELHAVSADHLDYITDEALEQLKKQGVTPVLLPGAVFYLGLKRYAPARKMIDNGLPVAIATDYNPGSCMTESMPIIMTIACIQMKILPEEAWIAATINAARAVQRHDKYGRMEENANADIVIWNIPNADYLTYHFGINHAHTVIKSGKIVYEVH
jgi:imidazolonepropionase